MQGTTWRSIQDHARKSCDLESSQVSGGFSRAVNSRSRNCQNLLSERFKEKKPPIECNHARVSEFETRMFKDFHC